MATNPRTIRISALVLAIAAFVVLYVLPSGPLGYLVCAATSGVAVIVGHRAVRRGGPLLWAGITGLALGYLMLILSLGLLVARITRILTGIV